MEHLGEIIIRDSLPESTVIWRYFSLDKFLYLILHKELYLSKIMTLDDKKEGSRPPEFKLLNLYVPIGGVSNKYKASREALKSKQVRDNQFLVSASNTFVNCWSMNKSESFALWCIYTDKNYGIAVKSTIGKLKESIKSNSHSINISRVFYEPDFTNKFSIDTIVKRKSEFYRFEEEVRLYISQSDNDSLQISVDIELLITEIYFSPFMKSNTKIAVKEWLSTKSESLSKKVKNSEIELRNI